MLIKRLQSLGIFACHCTVASESIHCGILANKRVAGDYQLTDPETKQRYRIQLPELSGPVHYGITLSLLPDHDESHPAA